MAADGICPIRDATPTDAADVRAIDAHAVETVCASQETVAPAFAGRGEGGTRAPDGV